MKKLWLKTGVVVSAATIIAACGGTGQDNGSVSSLEQNYTGLVIDGYLARATVFLDTNNDGTRNPWEPFAFTDNQGYFSYNPITGTDYCASDATAEQAQYCLVSNVEYSNVVLRVDSGYDVLTGEPFTGQMSRRVNPELDSGLSDSIVSPISSLLTNISDTSDQNTVLSTLGLESTDLDVDYLNADGSGSVDSGILNAALKVHKVVAVLSDRITDTYTEIGDEMGTPNDASSAVYPQLAQQLLTSGTTFDLTVANTTTIATVLDNAEEAMRDIYTENEFTLPADMGSPDFPNDFSRVINVAGDIVDVVNTIVDAEDTTVGRDDALGQARALESVVIKVLNETTTDSTIENAVNFFTNESNGTLVDALLQSLEDDTSDIVSLANNDFSGTDFDSVDEIVSSASLPESAEPFSEIPGMQIRVSDLDLGTSNDLDDSEIELYFGGSQGDVEGTFSACVKHIDGASADGTLGDGNTRGELVEGFWSLLGATSENTESYSLLLTITFLGATYQAIMKPAGLDTIGDVQYQRIRFDNLDEINIWHSELGLVEMVSIPETNEACQERLPSRVGLD